MTKTFNAVIENAKALVSAGRLGDATAIIMETLSGTGPSRRRDKAPETFDGPTIELSAARPGDDGSTGAQATRSTAPKGRRTPDRSSGVPPLAETLRAHLPKRLFDALPGLPAILSPGAAAADRAGVAVPDGAQFLTRHIATAFGSRSYKLFLPSTRRPGPAALVVMLHGCTQTPDDFALGTRMNEIAEAEGILIAYPEQPASANPNRCWNWFDTAHQRKGAGEPAIIAAMVEEIAAEFGIDRLRVFAAGLSAGGAMAAVLGATYPEVFAAVGVHSGLPYRSAADAPSAFRAMRGAAKPSRAPAGDAGQVRMIVFHGDADQTVHPSNGDALAGAGGRSGDRPSVKQGAINGRSYRRMSFAGPKGVPVLEHWVVEGLGHAWSGGDRRGSYAEATGPDASREMLRFFLQKRAS